MIDYTQLRTIDQIAEEAKFATKAKLRWWVFHAEKYGFKPVVFKIGGRVYLDKVEFNKWLERHRLGPKQLETQSA